MAIINGINIERTAAAYKAWETIRANQAAAARRDAALKAWETIRARKAARRDAALKAWETMRAAA
jgi:hypothetical protein